MAFFDDLGKKLSQAGQTAVQKTKEIADIARINGMISDEEKRIDNNYYQIGKLYVAMHQNDFESDFAGMIMAIREAEAKIKDYKQQIQTIKGVERCEKCGAEVAKGVAFCNACGAPMPKPEQPAADANLMPCAGCGAMIDKNLRFCTSCGKPTAPVAAPAEAPAPAPVVELVGKKCAHCGAELAADVAFCTECGKPTAETAPAEAPAPAVETNGKKCPNCGTEVAEDVAFCTECGTKLN